MSTIVTRTSKGSALTYAEMDSNLTNLNTDKLESSSLLPYATKIGVETLTNKTISLGSNTVSTTLAQLNSAVSDGDLISVAGLGANNGASLVGFVQAGTGAIATTIQNKLRESVSVKDFGAVGNGIADDTTSFSLAAKGTIATTNLIAAYSWLTSAPMCRVVVPAGNYLLTSTVDTGGREVVWALEPGANVIGYAFLNGRVERQGQKLNHVHNGILDYGVGYSISANGDLEAPAQVSGYTSASQLGTFTERDSVGLYVENTSPDVLADVTTANYTATTMVPGSALSATQVKKLRLGMLIDTKHVTKYSGFITGWAADGSSITVSAWYLSPGPGTTATPANGTGAYVNPFTKIWGFNGNVTLTPTGHATRASGFELGVINNLSSPASPGADPKVWGMDVVNLGAYMCETAHIARGAFWYGFQSIGQNTGFRYEGDGATLSSTTSGGLMNYQVTNGNVEAGNISSAGTVSYDFHSSGNNTDYDSRIIASGGTGVAGNGILTFQGKTLNILQADIRMSVLPGSYANDAAAAAGSVPIGALYRNGSAVQVRVT